MDAGLDLNELRSLPSAPGRRHPGTAFDPGPVLHPGPAFAEGLDTLAGTAHGHLANALTYTLHLPPRESGLRTFCGWTLAMALLTLRKIRGSRAYALGESVRVSRRTVRWAALASRGAVRADWSLRIAFRVGGRGLPFAPIPVGTVRGV